MYKCKPVATLSPEATPLPSATACGGDDGDTAAAAAATRLRARSLSLQSPEPGSAPSSPAPKKRTHSQPTTKPSAQALPPPSDTHHTSSEQQQQQQQPLTEEKPPQPPQLAVVTSSTTTQGAGAGYLAHRYSLAWKRAFVQPLCGLRCVDLTGDGLRELVVCSVLGLHISQVRCCLVLTSCLCGRVLTNVPCCVVSRWICIWRGTRCCTGWSSSKRSLSCRLSCRR